MNSLGLKTKPQDTLVAVAMSGGVDSSVTAALLLEQGYKVIGITMQLFDPEMVLDDVSKSTPNKHVIDAKAVAEKLGIDHHVVYLEDDFKTDVIDYFVDTYLQGKTPSPCAKCNKEIKFGKLIDAAKELGADALATGHYVQSKIDDCGKKWLMRGADIQKDQSYFLFALSQEQVNYINFPLGNLTSKDETRAMARKYDLFVADKPDSQDICFVPDGNYTKLIDKLRPKSTHSGDIVHVDGRILGKHLGLINYTIGQRRGLKLGGAETGGDPLYVVKLDIKKNHVIVGGKDDLKADTIVIEEINWLGNTPISEQSQKVLVKIRSNQQPKEAIIYIQGAKTIVKLSEPQFGISPGQACGIYIGDIMLGGGWISSAS